LAPSRALFVVPSSSIIADRSPAWSRASLPSSACVSTPFTLRDGLAHALAEIARLVAVAQLDASRVPVERPRAPRAASTPDSSITSASTVGLPRESMILAAADVA
jgi:hypothetical protein